MMTHFKITENFSIEKNKEDPYTYIMIKGYGESYEYTERLNNNEVERVINLLRKFVKEEECQTYRSYNIYFYPPPIPIRSMDWHFFHEDYDGAPDAFDRRYGSCKSVEACKVEIDELEDGK